jgi:hypothetical protein
MGAPEAEWHYRRALALALALDMRPMLAHCHLGLAMFYARADRTTEAREHGGTAVTMYREMDMRFWLQKTERVRAYFGATIVR